ncbi:SMP-30/gluconolactonase/LRE family protein [Rhodoferax sp. AJA081-3]|uniref:NHL repeat-containing protein n=1 Tax=Rhodoferax sp. AJA081-3 TaxID=2752316 RepID=UPI001ADF74C4|nr:NHL repeat-containing protein [Rhodoferax sp. AJA081-3]QTN29968.1 SMP-30/gluconolactonase/LRE family protein [Rhodoferax sp. AJA081-3]
MRHFYWARAMALACGIVSSYSPAQAADPGFTFTTLAGAAGTVINSVDGTGSTAQLYAPRGLAVGSDGTLYVADSANHSIRKVTAAGVVTTWSGTAGTAGPAAASPAQFNEPFAVALDSSGTLYVADTNNHAIRKISSAGVVSTLAGGNGPGSADGTGSAAKFTEPHGVALDAAGSVYVTDYMNHTVRKVTPAGVVTTLAGSAGQIGFTNGQGSAARFKSLQGIAVDGSGNVVVVDAGNRALRKITPGGLVSTLIDGSGSSLVGEPRGLAIDAAGSLYVTDYRTHAVFKLTAAGVGSILAGTIATPGSGDGTTTSAQFNAPNGVAVDGAGNVYIADTANNTLRKITGGSVGTLAGLAGRSSSRDGAGAAARFEDPYAVATDGAGNVYVADATDHSIRKIAPDGTVTTLAGKAGTLGSADGAGAAARFQNPQGIAADSAGNVFVADTGNRTIRKISSTGVVSTLAGSAGQGGSADGTGASARFNSPLGVAVDSGGTVYVIDSADNTVRKITPGGVVTTLAGSPGGIGLVDGTGSAARFTVPFDLTVDAAGNLYICDHGNHAIRKVTPAGVVTTLAGSGTAGNTNSNGRAAAFKFPSGITVDNSTGAVFVADTDNQVIRKISATGDVTTVGGAGTIGSADGAGTAASFYNPKDVATDRNGNLYVADRANHTVRKGSTAQAAVSTATSDCLFNWAERTYPQYFPAPSAATASFPPYYYRYYPGTANYLATSSAQGHVWVQGPVSGNTLMDVGAASSFVAQAGCQ